MAQPSPEATETLDTEQAAAVAWWNALPQPIRMHWFRASGHRTPLDAFRVSAVYEAASGPVETNVATCPRCGYLATTASRGTDS